MKKYVNPAMILSILILFFLLYILIQKPMIGKCDNGDFGRTMRTVGVIQTNTEYKEAFDGYVHKNYSITQKFPKYLLILWDFDWTSSVLVGKVAMIFNSIFNQSGFFDIRFMGFVYACIFSLAVYFIISYFKPNSSLFLKMLLGILIILFFTDIGYISYFNSFFGEAASLSFVFLLIGAIFYLLSSEKLTISRTVFFFIALMLFITSKQQNIPLIILLVPLALRFYSLNKDTSQKRLMIILMGITLFISCLAYAFIGSSTERCNKYQTVFTGVLKDSPTPEKDLEYLGIDKKFSVLAGSVYYTPNLPINPMDKSLDKTLFQNISRFKVLQFYIMHPDRMYQKIKVSAKHAYMYYTIHESNFEKGQYMSSKKIYNSFRTWFAGKYPSVHRSIFTFLTFTLLYFGILLVYRVRAKSNTTKLFVEFLISIGLCGVTQFFLPILGSGEGDLGKHLFQLNLFYDIMFVSSIVWIGYLLEKGFMCCIGKLDRQKVKPGFRLQ